MTSQTLITQMAVHPASPMLPHLAEITELQSEAPGITTLWLELVDPLLRRGYRFQPGQFNMLSLPGFGEAAISISSDPHQPERIGHTVRAIGNVTNALAQLKVGDQVGLRGPFGTYWPLEDYRGADILIATGGIGLPPLRPVIYEIIRRRQEFGRVVVLYGARTPRDLQYVQEYPAWEQAGIETMITVDRADESWQGQVGVVPILFYRLRINPQQSVVFTCGPEIMIRFVVFEALARRVAPERIYVSLERNMKCGQGSCGHCQMGPYFVCKDGPVFSFNQLQPYYNVENL